MGGRVRWAACTRRSQRCVWVVVVAACSLQRNGRAPNGERRGDAAGRGAGASAAQGTHRGLLLLLLCKGLLLYGGGGRGRGVRSVRWGPRPTPRAWKLAGRGGAGVGRAQGRTSRLLHLGLALGLLQRFRSTASLSRHCECCCGGRGRAFTAGRRGAHEFFREALLPKLPAERRRRRRRRRLQTIPIPNTCRWRLRLTRHCRAPPRNWTPPNPP